MSRREQTAAKGADTAPKIVKSASRYTGRKGAIVERLVGSDSGYKTHVSRHFRRNLNQIVNRGPTQEVVQLAKAEYNLNTEDGRIGWKYRRVILFGADGRGTIGD